MYLMSIFTSHLVYKETKLEAMYNSKFRKLFIICSV